jgi:hypothetical protein
MNSGNRAFSRYTLHSSPTHLISKCMGVGLINLDSGPISMKSVICSVSLKSSYHANLTCVALSWWRFIQLRSGLAGIHKVIMFTSFQHDDHVCATWLDVLHIVRLLLLISPHLTTSCTTHFSLRCFRVPVPSSLQLLRSWPLALCLLPSAWYNFLPTCS